jgi:hypothetical protein
MSALAGYLAVAQLAQHLDLALPDDIAAGEHVTLGSDRFAPTDALTMTVVPVAVARQLDPPHRR